MSTEHKFGGTWTEKKLKFIGKYLHAYTKIFQRNPYAQKYHTIYVDAFAGTGYRTVPFDDTPLFEENDLQVFLKGSARIALEIDPPFKEYIFVEQNPIYAEELAKMKAEFSAHRPKITILNENAEPFLTEWASKINWQSSRSVVFLDSYGMQISWETIKALGKTKAIDLWLLFPLGVAVNRLLTRHEPPPPPWAAALTRVFGTDAWLEEFYPRKKTRTLFGEEETHAREGDMKTIGEFFLRRLKTAFQYVAPKPFILYNSRQNPIYWLYFASGNNRGGPTAVKIAQDILDKS